MSQVLILLFVIVSSPPPPLEPVHLTLRSVCWLYLSLACLVSRPDMSQCTCTRDGTKKKVEFYANTTDNVRHYSWMLRTTTTLTATSFKQKILTVSSYYTKRRVRNGLQFLIKPFITSTFFSSSEGKRHGGRVRMEREMGGSVYRHILK